MNKIRKIELLYQKAKGQKMNASSDEMRELRKYKIDAREQSFYTTKANIRDYIEAVDNRACRLSFYDWCMNNKKADRRRKNSSEKDITSFNRGQDMSVIFIGWLIWGVAIYWMFNGSMQVGGCAFLGAIVALILFKCARKLAMFTLVILPIILAVVFGS